MGHPAYLGSVTGGPTSQAFGLGGFQLGPGGTAVYTVNIEMLKLSMPILDIESSIK